MCEPMMELDISQVSWTGTLVDNLHPMEVKDERDFDWPVLAPLSSDKVPEQLIPFVLPSTYHTTTRAGRARHAKVIHNASVGIFTIPPEMRMLIYRLVLGGKALEPHVNWKLTRTRYAKTKQFRIVYSHLPPIDLRLLTACRQIFLDARYVPYEANHFVFKIELEVWSEHGERSQTYSNLWLDDRSKTLARNPNVFPNIATGYNTLRQDSISIMLSNVD